MEEQKKLKFSDYSNISLGHENDEFIDEEDLRKILETRKEFLDSVGSFSAADLDKILKYVNLSDLTDVKIESRADLNYVINIMKQENIQKLNIKVDLDKLDSIGEIHRNFEVGVIIPNVQALSNNQLENIRKNINISSIEIPYKTIDNESKEKTRFDMYKIDTYEKIRNELEKITNGININKPDAEKFLDIYRKLGSKINYNLEELIKTIYQRWFIEFEFPNEEGKPYKSSGDKFVYNDELKQEIPEGWNVKKITEIANVYQPEIITIKDIDLNGDYLLYGAGGLMGKYNKFNHEKSAIAISCRGNCGDTFMTQPKSWINGNVMVVAPIEKYNYKEYIFRSLFKEKIMPLITGSVQKQITRTNLSNLKLLIPNKRTLELFEDTVKPYRSKINLVINENQRLTELKNFLLPLLMNGQINVDDIEI